VEVFLQGQDELFHKTGIQSCRNEGTSAFKLVEIMWKNEPVTVVVFCFYIYEAGNFWNSPCTSLKCDLSEYLLVYKIPQMLQIYTKYDS